MISESHIDLAKTRIINQSFETELYEDLDEMKDFRHLITLLNMAKDGDKINILIACNGGRCDIGQIIIHAMKNSKAYITTEVLYPTYSMGSCIALAGKELKLHKGAFLMFHNYSGGAGGKGDALVQGVISDDKALKTFNDGCMPFLSKPEMNKINSDKDIYIFWDDISLQERIDRHFGNKTSIKKRPNSNKTKGGPNVT